MAEVAPEPELDPRGYLLANLETLVAETLDHDRALWRAAELDRWRRWRGLPVGARRVWARLVSRVGPWFRRDQVRDPGGPPIDPGLEALAEGGWISFGARLAVADRLRLLRRAELLAAGATLGLTLGRSRHKSALIEALLHHSGVGDLPELEPVRFLRPEQTDGLDRARLLFFGDLDHDWTEWLLRDLGVTAFEPYEVDRAVRRFAAPEDLDRALGLRRTAAAIDASRGLDADGLGRLVAPWLALAPEAWAQRERRLLARCATAWGRALERAGRLDEAFDVLARVGRSPARERAIRVASRLGRHHQAERLCAEVLADPQDPLELDLARHWGAGRRRPRATPGWRVETHELERGGEPVEAAVARVLAARGSVHFTENWWWRAVFGLLFWDVLFAPVPGVFLHPFQTAPADLYQPEFRQRREGLIDDRLALIFAAESSALQLRASECWQAKCGIANDFVAWEPSVLDLVHAALPHVAGTLLAAVFDRMVGNLAWHRRGFPDLMVLTPHGFELHEVKGPGDQLRPEQRSWLELFAAAGVPTHVARVRWTEPERAES